MEIKTQQIDLNNLDRSSWQTYRFDQIAKMVSERVDPNDTELEIYVGLEHLDAESIHIKRKGTPADVKGQKLKCYPGDVIFGKRRAYQRKAAIVDFEGICSAHAFVLRANPKVIDPKLFPFFLHADQFMHRAVDISVGGLSPTINWKTLREQEFLLPPKEEQARLAELLWAMDDVVERERENKLKISNYFESSRNEIFSKETSKHYLNILSNNDFEEQSITKLLKEKMTNGIYKSKEFQGNGDRIINMGELFAYPIIRNQDMALIELTEREKKQFFVKQGDLIFARRSLVIEGAGKCAIIGEHDSPMAFESSMIRVRLDHDKLIPKYVFHFLNSKEGKRRIRRIVGFTTVAGIASSDLANIKLPCVSVKRQKEIIKFLDRFESLFHLMDSKIATSQSLQKSLINQIF